MERSDPKMSLGDWVIALLFAAIILVVGAGVVWRYVLSAPLSWTKELSGYLFTWLIFVGAALAVKEGAHIRIEVLLRKLPPGAGRLLDALHQTLIIVFLGYVIFVGGRYVAASRHSPSPVLRVPMDLLVYTALPAGALLGIWFAIGRAVRDIRSASAPQDDAQEDG
jgi:TRAP-type C4-dicarboxylate transport system permease small subunit